MVFTDLTPSSRHVALWIKGFEMSPEEARKLLPVHNVFMRRKGDFTRNGRLIRDNLLIYSFGFDGDQRWSDAINGLVDTLGGWETLENILTRIDPQERSLDFTIPVRGSLNQENNFFNREILIKIGQLGLPLGFSFSDFDRTDPTHISPNTDYGDEA